MAVTFGGVGTFTLVGNYSKADTGVSLPGLVNYTNSPTMYTSGSGDYQVNAAWISLGRSLAAAGESHDLFGGLVDVYGTTLNFTAIKQLFIRSYATSALGAAVRYLRLSGTFLDGDTNNLGPLGGASAVVAYLGPGGSFLWDSPIDGATCANGAKDVLTVTNAATFTYDIIILGVI